MTSQSNTSEIILYKTSDGHAIVMIRCRGDRLAAPATPGPRSRSWKGKGNHRTYRHKNNRITIGSKPPVD